MTLSGKVLVTGATGFIGKALSCSLIAASEYTVITASRAREPVFPQTEHRQHDLLDGGMLPALHDVHTVVHTAARVHVMDDQSSDKLAAFRAANVTGTAALANAAAEAGVTRFIYLSSIKVNGEQTQPGLPFTARDPANPQDAYGVSKHEAEIALREIATRTGLQVVIVRPPLVYGPGAKANFKSMMKWLDRGVPLPLGAINNRRSMVALGNLVDLLSQCIKQPAAVGQTFLVSDGDDLSTTQLMQQVAKALGRRSLLLPIPSALLSGAAALLGKGTVAQRLCGSLQVDIALTRELLAWEPPISVSEGLQQTADAFLLEKKPATNTSRNRCSAGLRK